jgi:hypothetical protein
LPDRKSLVRFRSDQIERQDVVLTRKCASTPRLRAASARLHLRQRSNACIVEQ